METVMKRNAFLRWSVLSVTAAVLALSGAALAHEPKAKGGPPGTVARPDLPAYGTTYGELAGAWWNWALAGPTAENPVLDPDGRYCALRQSGRIWFLAGNFGGAFGEPNPTFRTCTVPAGKALFFPLFNSLYWYPEDGNSVEEVRPKAIDGVEPATSLSVTIDGVLVADPFAYRAASPRGGFEFNVAPGSIVETDFGYAPGPRFPAVADGYWMLVHPLSPGHHTLRIQAAATSIGFQLDVTYELEVVGKGR
jgi:hypothetical protein